MNAHKHFKWQHHVNMFFFILLFQKHMKAHEIDFNLRASEYTHRSE